MKSLMTLALLLSLPAAAAQPKFLTPDQIHEQFLHPHVQTAAEKAKHLKAHKPFQIPKLTDTIPQKKLDELDAKKAKRQEDRLKLQKKKTSFMSWLFPEAYAMGCKQVVKPDPTPVVPSPVVAPVAPVSTPTAAPSVAPSAVPSATPSVTPSASPTGLPTSVDWRSRDEEIKTQFGGTCTAFGLAAAIENEMGKVVKRDLSERHLWSLYGQYDVYAAVDAALHNKITELQYWPDQYTRPTDPQYAQKAKTQLVTARELDDNSSAAIQALAAGHPVYVGMAVPQSLADCDTVIANDSAITSGGHAMSIVGYRMDPAASGGAYLILRNSWGTDCGDSGYLYFPVGLCEANKMYCLFWSIESVNAGL